MSPERQSRSSRWLSRCLVAAVLVTASLAIPACGSSRPTTILDTEKVERAIEHSTLTQRGQHAAVSCPSGVHQKVGLIFACTAVVKRTSTRFMVTELDESGHVHYEAR